MATNNSAQPLDIEVALTKSEKFINTYKKPLIIGFVALIAIVLAWFGGHRWLSNREDAAQAQLALGEQYFATGQYDLALKGDTANTGKDAFKGYEAISKEYSFTDAANVAHLYAGTCYYRQGNAKKAIEHLEAFSPKDDTTISANGIATLANSYAADGQLDKAVDTHKKAAKHAGNAALSPLYLMQAAQILESQNKKEDAHNIYLDIKEKYPTSQYCNVNENNGVVIGAEIDKYIERTK